MIEKNASKWDEGWAGGRENVFLFFLYVFIFSIFMKET